MKLLCLLVPLLFAYGDTVSLGPEQARLLAPGSPSAAVSPRVPETGPSDEELARLEYERCQSKIARVLKQPGLPGAPRLEARRAQVLGRGKATPVLFVETPLWKRSDDPRTQLVRQQLTQNPSARGLGRLYRVFQRQPQLAREVLLRDGYLYTDEPALAFALVQKVALEHLFTEPEIVIQRGMEELVAQSSKQGYVYTTGVQAGEPAKVLLFDRVWSKGNPPAKSLHVDLERAAEALGFWRARLEHATQESLVMNLGYADQWVLSLLSRKGPTLVLECELVEQLARQEVFRARRTEKRRHAVFRQQRQAIDAMVHEALPFDEPRTEEGQQDGNLRPKWRGAYRRGEWYFEFNEDRYAVFDSRGRPRVPQVCIDFITDTLERASGSWWLPRDQKRSRAPGRLSFDEFPIDNKRSVERFTKFAWEHPQYFDVYYLPDEERIPLRAGDAFYAALERHAARYRPGDIVNILGLKSDEKLHYHSFFVYKADPVTGMPIWLAGNAGRPRVRSWYGDMLNAPRRSIHSRIRPRLGWLESVLGVGRALATEPAGAAQETSG